jgi:hypothetical protein
VGSGALVGSGAFVGSGALVGAVVGAAVGDGVAAGAQAARIIEKATKTKRTRRAECFIFFLLFRQSTIELIGRQNKYNQLDPF